MTSIFENFRHVLSPKPSASATVTLPLPSWHDDACQQANALSSCAWVNGTVARCNASFITGGSESAVMLVVCSAALTVFCRSAGDTEPAADDELLLPPLG